jgi:hypothetical protein
MAQGPGGTPFNAPCTSRLAQHLQHHAKCACLEDTGGRLALDKGVHHFLEDFQWMQENVSTCPTWMAEIVPCLPVAEGHYNASGLGAGGIWFPGPHLAPPLGFTSTQPIVWWHRWPDFISSWLVMADNPHGSITNSDLELAGGLFHLDALSKCFDIREWTVLSKGDNLSTTFWECRDSTSTNSPLRVSPLPLWNAPTVLLILALV